MQGLLLLTRNELPVWFMQNWPKLFNRWFAFQEQAELTSDALALGFVLKQCWADKIITGVDNARQLKRLLEIEKMERYNFIDGFSVNDENLLNPSNWKL